MSLVGQRFGMLIVIREFERRGKPNGVRVRCDCGREKDTCSRSVRRGRTRSCGCMQKASARRHGFSICPEYHRWRAMIDRCHNPQNVGYANYGGRGITVCKEWRNEPAAYIAWFRANGGGEGREVDRIDNDLGYAPENCRIVAKVRNARNTRANRLVTLGGEQMTVADAAERFGVAYATLYQRIYRLGWSPERAVREPTRNREAAA